METNATIATPDNRVTVPTTPDVTIADLLNSNSVNYSRASVMLDGTTLSDTQMGQTLQALGAGSDCTISVCVKLQNA